LPSFGQQSRDRLATVHPDLRRLFERVVLTWDCTVVSARRTHDEQRELVLSGNSQTMESKHLPQADGWAHAIDVVPWPVAWDDLERFAAFGGYVLGTAADLSIAIRWGRAWNYPKLTTNIDQAYRDARFKDYPHFELV